MKTPIPCYCITPALSNRRIFALAVLMFLGLCTTLSGLDFVSEGEKQLTLNNPAKAVTYLEAAMAQGSPNERLLLNLGLAYQRVGQSADARRTFQLGADLLGPARKTFLLNLGVSSFLAKDWAMAETAYSAALTLDPVYTEALLNRANNRLNLKDWAGAAVDYRAYQKAYPTNPQKEKIDQVLALLDRSAAEADALRLAEETRKKNEAAAAEKTAAEAAALKKAQDEAAEAERLKQEALLAQIRESLAAASDDSKALSTGPSDVKADDGEFSLDP